MKNNTLIDILNIANIGNIIGKHFPKISESEESFLPLDSFQFSFELYSFRFYSFGFSIRLLIRLAFILLR